MGEYILSLTTFYDRKFHEYSNTLAPQKQQKRDGMREGSFA